jgi:hypothetical protein
MRSVVVLPQPEGPSRQKNSPSSTVKLDSTAMKRPEGFCTLQPIWPSRLLPEND